MILNSFVCDFHHCCFFYPLGKGLLVWAYLNLVRYCMLDGISSSTTATRISFHFAYPDDGYYQDLLSITLMFVVTLLLSLTRLAFNIVFVIGMHKKDDRLLRSHYYYWITTLALYSVFYVGINILSIFIRPFYNWLWLHLDPVTYHMALEQPFIGLVDIVVQVYFLTLVRNHIRELDSGDQLAFISDYFETRGPGRPLSMAETVRSAIDTQPRPSSPSSHRF